MILFLEQFTELIIIALLNYMEEHRHAYPWKKQQ